jgi:hypothetical protein
MEMQQGHAYTFLKTLAVPLLREFELWNRISNVVPQREEEARICTFFLRAQCFAFFHARFYLLWCSQVLKRKKAQTPTSVLK